MPKKMLINTAPGQECRIAVVSEDGLEELYVERTSAASRVGNVYKARVTNVEAAIQAAFVDIGLGKNGFLHISDVNPTYFPKNKRGVESVGQKRSHHYRPPIQECLRRGQEVVVQMIKEGIGTKGPTMTTYLSIPGRLLVMMPGMSKLGVSRKVEDEEARDKARDALDELDPAAGHGLHRPHGRDRPAQTRAPARPELPAPPLEGRQAADQEGQDPLGDLPGVRPRHRAPSATSTARKSSGSSATARTWPGRSSSSSAWPCREASTPSSSTPARRGSSTRRGSRWRSRRSTPGVSSCRWAAR